MENTYKHVQYLLGAVETSRSGRVSCIGQFHGTLILVLL